MSTVSLAPAAPVLLRPRAASLRQMLAYRLRLWGHAFWQAAEAWGRQRARAELQRQAWRWETPAPAAKAVEGTGPR